MSLTKEWLIPISRALTKNNAHGPVYALGDQVSYLTHSYAQRKLSSARLLRNPNAPFVPCNQDPDMVSFRTVLSLLGLEGYYDIDMNGEAAITADLSSPLDDHLHNRAGVVIDIGTCEHIFNLPQVFENVIRLLRPGGIALHLAPLSWYNHGFVNFNPIFFREFYEHNGFTELEHGLIVTPLEYPLQFILGRLGLETRYYKSQLSPFSFVVNDEHWIVRRLANHFGLAARVIFLFAARKGSESKTVLFPHQKMYSKQVSA